MMQEKARQSGEKRSQESGGGKKKVIGAVRGQVIAKGRKT